MSELLFTTDGDVLVSWVGSKMVSLAFLDPTGELFAALPESRAPEVDILQLWWLYDALRSGQYRVRTAVYFGFRLAGYHADANTKDTLNEILKKIQEIGDSPNASGEERKNTGLLKFTYGLLQHKLITYDDASQLATIVLRKEIKPDAWRKRIDRWIDRQKLPKVDLRRQGDRSADHIPDVQP